MFFTKSNVPIAGQNSRGKTRVPGSRTLGEVLKCPDAEFVDLVQRCLVWDPVRRLAPEDARDHRWLASKDDKKKNQKTSFLHDRAEDQNKPKNLSYRREIDPMQTDKTDTKLNASLSGVKMTLNASYASNPVAKETAHNVGLHSKLNVLREKLKETVRNPPTVLHANAGRSLSIKNQARDKAKNKASAMLQQLTNRSVLPPLSLIRDSLGGGPATAKNCDAKQFFTLH